MTDRIRPQRLTGERLTADHLNDLLILDADPQMMAMLGGIRAPDGTQAYLTRNLDHWTQYGFGLWIFRDSTGALIGRGGLRHVLVDDVDEVDIGYALLPQFWGRGYATEMGQEFLRIADGLHLRNLAAITQPEHHTSRRVMEKLDFHYEKDIVHFDTPCVLYRRT